MPPVTNLVQPAGYPASTIPDVVRAIFDIYAGCAEKEGASAPTILFGRRHARQDAGADRIVIVPSRGPIVDPRHMGGGLVSRIAQTVKAYLWAPEPEIGADELENELARFDEADPMLERFLNVLSRIAPGRIELVDVDPDADQSNPAAVNQYGETYVVTFRFLRDIPRDGVVFSVMPTLDADGLPTPTLSPAPTYAVEPAASATVNLTVDPSED